MPQMQDEAGNIWEVDANGEPVALVQSGGAQPITMGTPDPYAQPKAKADLDVINARISDIQADNARADREVNKPPAGYRWTADKTLEIIPGGPADKTAKGGQKNDKVIAAERLLSMLDGEGGIVSQFESNFKDQGLASPLEYVGGLRSANQQFDVKANAMLPFAKKLLRTPGEGAQSDKEAQDYRDQLPRASFRDETNEQLISDLRQTALSVIEANGVDISTYNPESGTFNAPPQQPPQENAIGRTPPSPALNQAPVKSDATQQRMVGGNNGSVEASSGQFETVDDPALAGVNNQIYNMLVGGKSAAEIGSYLESRGINPIPIMGAIQENVKIQKTNPGVRPTINVDDILKEVPLSRQISSDVLNSNIGAAGVGYGNAMTAGLLDEGVDFLGGQNTQQTKEYLRNEYPVSSGLGELTGAVIGMKGAGSLLKKAPMLANTGSKGALAGDVGYGALYGAGEANDDRLTGAAYGAGATLAGNQIGQRVLAPITRKALETAPVKAGVNSVRGLLKKAPMVPAVKPEKTQGMIVSQTDDGVIQSLQEAQDLGLPMALADTNPKLRTLAGSAVRKSPAAREFAESTIEPRAAGQSERASQAVNDYLQPVGDITSQQEQLIKQARAQAGPFYEQTYNAPGAGAAFESIEPLLQRPTMRDAMQRGQRIASDEGIDPNALGYNFDEAGNVIYERAPSWQSYDYAKRGLDDVIQANNNPMTGGLNSQGRSAQQIKAQLLKIIDERNPAYKQAREAYEGPISIKGAIDQGRKAGNMKPDVMAGQMRGMNDTRSQGFKTGYAASMDDRINNAQMTGNPYKRVYGTPNQQANVQQLFPEGAQQFGRIKEIEDQMAKTAYETLGGSPTAARGASDALFDGGGMAGNAAEIGLSAATGVPPVNAMMQGIRNFGADGVRLGLGKRSEQRAAAIAPTLLDTNPQAGIDFLNNALAQRAAYDAWRKQAAQRGGDVGAGLGVLATAPLVN